MKFLDQVKVFIASGHGGAGSMSFRREKFIEFGGPDGGDGGCGGHVWIEATKDLNTLIDFRYQQHFTAQRGGHGMGRNRSGRNGENIILRVPTGTQIFDETHEGLIIDMETDGQRFRLARGGDGGFGNAHYKTSTNQSPRRSDPGWPGEERWIWLQLKLIADIGLVGLPNSGKSTLLSVVSRAKPKIADYPFTTLYPQLGVVYHRDQEFVLADLPGLIEDAHQGVGLGHRFLGHVERCKAIIHVIDATHDDVAKDYQIIRHELGAYHSLLSAKQELIVLNKIDVLTEEEQEDRYQQLRAVVGPDQPIFLLSGVTKQGLIPLLDRVLIILKGLDPS